MPRSSHEARQSSAARADQDSNTRDRRDDTPATGPLSPHERPTTGPLNPHGTTFDGRPDEITDEGLGLSPGRPPTDDERRGSGKRRERKIIEGGI